MNATVADILDIVRNDQVTDGPTLDDAARELEGGFFDGIPDENLSPEVAARAALILRRTINSRA
jgi:hypothetical protein